VNISRYPATRNQSLRAWSAADEYILKELAEMEISGKNLAVCNDRFGYLAAHLHDLNPYSVIAYQSQKSSLMMNLQNNGVTPDSEKLLNLLEPFSESIDIGVLIVPKSLSLFQFYLHQLYCSLNEDGIIICGFMTRHFTKQILTIAGEYFEDVRQSLAWKKSRVLILKGKKQDIVFDPVETIPFTFKDGTSEDIRQYAGVFSSGRIDFATQFLIEHLAVTSDEQTILDLASGNGVIARAIQLQKPDAELHLMDDYFLAVESSKLNLDHDKVHFHWRDSIEDIGNVEFDLVVSNPPFHFAHEENIEVAVDLFREVAGKLKPGGRFLCVANKHIGYQSYLKKFFTSCTILAENRKYIVYDCKKSS
jgi:23S rRNA (guanine1835-N2)-methyltransferase